MTSEKRDAIEKIANIIRDTLEIETPVDMKTVIAKLKGEIEEHVFEDSSISGSIQKIKETDSFKIQYSVLDSERRTNFTIAHELGHLFIHMGYLIDKEKWDLTDEYCDSPFYRQGYSEEEYEANQFAAAFLMPEKEYKDYVESIVKDGKVKINSIADHFCVSFDAALTRGKWLNVFSWD